MKNNLTMTENFKRVSIYGGMIINGQLCEQEFCKKRKCKLFTNSCIHCSDLQQMVFGIDNAKQTTPAPLCGSAPSKEGSNVDISSGLS